MGRLALSFVLGLLLSSFAFSEDPGSLAEQNIRAKLDGVSYDDLVRNSTEVQGLSFDLGLAERQRLYAEFEKPVWPVILNIFPGHGLGSFIQNDHPFGAGLLVGSIITEGIGFVGLGSFAMGLTYALATDRTTQSEAGDYFSIGTGLVLVAGLGELVILAIGVSRGLYFPLTYNSKLREALALSNIP